MTKETTLQHIFNIKRCLRHIQILAKNEYIDRLINEDDNNINVNNLHIRNSLNGISDEVWDLSDYTTDLLYSLNCLK